VKKRDMQMRESIRGSRGFTMVEMMIAVSILAIIITGMTIALQQQQRQFKLTKEAVDVDQTARATLDFLASEIRNAGARQGKTFAIQFFNGGSEGAEPCTEDTNDPASVDSPPDCLTIYTWDITRGQDGADLPSIVDSVKVNQNSPLELLLPQNWFDEENVLIGGGGEDGQVLLGIRSRLAVCNPDSQVNCLLEPERCTECAVVLRATVDGSTKTATVDSLDDIIVHNFPVASFSGVSDFVNGVTVNGLDYGLVPTIADKASEMTIVDSKTIRIDPVNKSLLLSRNGGDEQLIVGGPNAPGIVDLQLVFNLQDSSGRLSKVGVPLSAADGLYPDFSATALNGREQDIRSVEIYIVVKSKMKPKKMTGGEFKQLIPAIGDVLERTVDSPSAATSEPEEGYTYRILSTTVYMRNHSREEFG